MLVLNLLVEKRARTAIIPRVTTGRAKGFGEMTTGHRSNER